jgi:hypothetical protein
MRCVEFEMRLNELLDERLPPSSDPVLESHAVDCPQCGDLLSAHEALLDAAEGLARWPSRSDLAVRVAADLVQPRGRRLGSWIWALVAMAAALLISLGLWRWRAGANPAPFAGNELVAQADNTATPSTLGTTSTLQQTDPRLWISQSTQQAATDFGARDWTRVEQMADGLKPVADSMSAAWEALRRTWPHVERTARS